MTSTWKEVKRSHPCPICGKDHWCSISDDGAWVVCRRADSGAGKYKVDKAGGEYWVYCLVDNPLPGRPEPEIPESEIAVNKLDPAVLDRAYNVLLNSLSLSKKHRENLLERGLSEDEIMRRGYRTLPAGNRSQLADKLINILGEKIGASLPGIYLKKSGNNSWWSLAGPPGTLIPVRDIEERIVALKVRRDDGAKPKYLYLSSKKQNGAGPGSPVHVPLFNGNTEIVRLTEGELKGDVATLISSVLTISIPGVSVWRPALPVIKALGAKIVRLAFDADARRNRNVAQALARTMQALTEEGFTVEVERWDEADGKGIDDLLAAGKKPEVLTGDKAATAVKEIVTAAREANPLPAEQAMATAREIASGLTGKVKKDPGFAFEQEVLGALALLQKNDPGEWTRLKKELAKAGVGIRELNRAIKKVSRPALRVVQPGEQPEGLPIYRVVPDAPVSDELIVPPGWKLTRGGVAIQKIRNTQYGEEVDYIPVAPSPIMITGRLKNIADGTESVRLSWLRDGQWQSHTAERAQVANSKSLVDLANIGFPVTSTKAKQIVDYMADFEAANIEHIPRANVTKQMGWQGDGGSLGFLWGRTLLRANGDQAVTSVNLEEISPDEWRDDWIAYRGTDEGDEQLADGFHAEGSMDEWLRAATLASQFPRVALAIYASLAPPLLAVLGAPNFVCDWSYVTSTGKTTTLRLGASCWGNPDERSPAAAIGTWDSTRTWIERASAILNGLPLILDDTKRAKNKKHIAQILYDVASGRGRGRGTPRGMSRAGHWATVLLSNGEAPATSFTEDGGTRARVLTCWGLPFGRSDETTAPIVNQLDVLLRSNYGQAGPRCVHFILKNKNKWDKWRNEYRRVQAGYLERAGANPVAGRMSAYFAVLDIAAGIAHAALDLPWSYKDPIDSLWEDLIAEASDADQPTKALAYVISWAKGHQSEFWGRHRLDRGLDARSPSGGWAGKWDSDADGDGWNYIGFLPHKINAILLEAGFEPEPVIRTWKDRGWLMTDNHSKKARYRARVEGEASWLVAITREAIDNLDAN